MEAVQIMPKAFITIPLMAVPIKKIPINWGLIMLASPMELFWTKEVNTPSMKQTTKLKANPTL